jgi:hypothetical protein
MRVFFKFSDDSCYHYLAIDGKGFNFSLQL